MHFFASVCLNRDVPYGWADFYHLTFMSEKNFSYQIIFVGPFENGALLVVCVGYSSIGEGERNKNRTSHTRVWISFLTGITGHPCHPHNCLLITSSIINEFQNIWISYGYMGHFYAWNSHYLLFVLPILPVTFAWRQSAIYVALLGETVVISTLVLFTSFEASKLQRLVLHWFGEYVSSFFLLKGVFNWFCISRLTTALLPFLH